MTFPKIDNAMLNTGSGAANGLVLLSTQVVTSPIAQVDFTTGIDSTYKEYMIRGTDITVAASDYLGMRLRLRGTFQTINGYTYGGYLLGNATGGVAFTNADNTSFIVIPGIQPVESVNGNGGFVLNITNPAGTSRIKALHVTGGGTGQSYNSGFGFYNGGAWNNGGTDYAPFDGIRFIASNGNIATGTFKLYGLS